MKRLLTCVLLAMALLPAAAQNSAHNAETAKQLSIFNNLYKELDLNYVDTLDAKDVIEDAIYYLLERLDPYTDYYPADRTEDLRQMTTGKYAGIGSLITYHAGHDRCIISEPYAGMPAAEAGLRRGDVIVAIDGQEMPRCGGRQRTAYSDSVSSTLRGEPGTTLRLRVERFGESAPLDFTLTRRTIALPAVRFAEMINDSVALVAVSQFTENTAAEVQRALTELRAKGMKRLVLDLRGNPGGLMMEAVKLVGLFVPKGSEVVSTRGKVSSRNETFRTTGVPMITDMPIVVLTDYGTASAGEITAGALQDYDRAVIVGQRTYGKGLVQEPHELLYGGVLKLTTCKYYIPSGRCVQAYEFSDGLPQHLADSVSREFHTKGGRPVRDCGGVTPDVEVAVDSLPNLITYLAVSDQLSDFVARYRSTHATIAPAETFSLTAAEYDDLTNFLKTSGFTYDRQSSYALKLLRDIAEHEGYAEQARAEFDALEQKFTHNEDYDYRRWEPEIRRVVEDAILTDYYYQRGGIVYDLRVSPEVRRALEILGDMESYRRILRP